MVLRQPTFAAETCIANKTWSQQGALHAKEETVEEQRNHVSFKHMRRRWHPHPRHDHLINSGLCIFADTALA